MHSTAAAPHSRPAGAAPAVEPSPVTSSDSTPSPVPPLTSPSRAPPLPRAALPSYGHTALHFAVWHWATAWSFATPESPWSMHAWTFSWSPPAAETQL